MARAGFGNPKVKKGDKVFLCPKCGGELTRTKLNNKTMVLSCHKSAKKLPVQDGWAKTHENYDAGCDVTVDIAVAEKTLQVKD
jgi:transcription elongation factor Elf1